MKVAVTGATGFVGRHVLDALSTTTNDVIPVGRDVLDMADPGSDPYGRIGSPDVLVHLAWGGLPNYRSNDHLDEQLPMQRDFLEACVASGLPRLVVAGTCQEYGMRSGELDERVAVEPTTAYAVAKVRLCRSLEELAARNAFDLSWLRLFYVYGPGQAETSLYTQLRCAVERGDPDFPMSAGDQIRDFLPIADAASIIAAIAMRAGGAGIVNVCSGQPSTVRDHVQRMLDEWGATIELRLGEYPYPDYEPFAFWGSRTKLDEVMAA